MTSFKKHFNIVATALNCGYLHYENTPIQIYTENFTSKNWKFSDKKLYIFYISAQNIDYGTR